MSGIQRFNKIVRGESFVSETFFAGKFKFLFESCPNT